MAGIEQRNVLMLGVLFPIIATIAVFLRFKARKIQRLGIEADDWTVAVAHVHTRIFPLFELYLPAEVVLSWRHFLCATLSVFIMPYLKPDHPSDTHH